MGKRIISRARGKGSLSYRVPPHKVHLLGYRRMRGMVVDIIHDQMRTAPIAKILYEDNKTGFMIAPEGISVNSRIDTIAMPLSEVPVGSTIFAIEAFPHSGPKFCLTGGSSATLLSKEERTALVSMPSRKEKKFPLGCYALVGRAAGDGRKEKPFMKAGHKWFNRKAKGKLYPRSGAVAMNAVDHPFGGKSGPGQSKSVSRHMPPGKKVGSISPRRTGRKKK